MNDRAKYYLKNKQKILKNRTKNKTKFLCIEMYSRAKRRAKRKNIEFDLSVSDILNIIPEVCPYFSVPFTEFSNIKNMDFSMSLDRIDNNKGYIKDNVQVISFRANVLKNDATFSEFEKLIKWMENWKEENNDPNMVLKIYKKEFLKHLYANKKKHLKVDLSFEEFVSRFPLNKKCPVFGFDFNFEDRMKYNSISIDKFLPNVGYEINNVSIISRKANTIKSNASLKELKQIFSAWKTQIKDI